MTAHSHWRLYCPPASTFVNLYEVAFLGLDGTDLSVGGTASSSSQSGPGNGPDKVFDKGGAVAWANASTDTRPWIQYATPTPVDARQVVVSFANTNLPGAIWVEGAEAPGGPWEVYHLAGAPPATSTTVTYELKDGPQQGVLLNLSSSVVYQPQYPTDPLGAVALALSPSPDLVHGGAGQVPVLTLLAATPMDLPVSRLVRLHRQVDGLPIRQAWSSAAGELLFKDVNPDFEYYTVSFDHTGDKRGTIADHLTPEVLP